MIQSKTILQALPNVLKEIQIPGFGKRFQGKVRDVYEKDGKRITITTDRQSGFDLMLGHVPFKGVVLNMLAAFWFKKTKHIIPNHMISVPDPNVLISRNLKGIPIEIIVRGYMSGVTNTSIWGSYKKGERIIYGIKFPDGLKKNQILPTPIITPTTHGGGKGGHDERLTRDDIIKKRLIYPKIYNQMEKAALELFNFGSRWCMSHGLILVDTKYEFGLDKKGKLYLMDEIHTPDSSRFWIAKTYQQRFKKGFEPENFDKEFIRLWYMERIDPYKDKIPPMPKELIVATSKRYIAVYEKITGQKFKSFKYPIEKRIKQSLKDLLN